MSFAIQNDAFSLSFKILKKKQICFKIVKLQPLISFKRLGLRKNKRSFCRAFKFLEIFFQTLGSEIWIFLSDNKKNRKALVRRPSGYN